MWAIKLRALLPGRAMDVKNTRMSNKDATCNEYDKLKKALITSSLGDVDAVLDLIVKEQFINSCSDEFAVYQLERGPKNLIEMTT